MLSSGIIRPPEASCPRFFKNTGYFHISFSVRLMRSRLLEVAEFSIRRIFICLWLSLVLFVRGFRMLSLWSSMYSVNHLGGDSDVKLTCLVNQFGGSSSSRV